MFNIITDFIIKEIQENSNSSMSGFQYIVDYEEIERKFSIQLGEDMIQSIGKILNNREEVADVVLGLDGFDVVLYTDFTPNYISKKS